MDLGRQRRGEEAKGGEGPGEAGEGREGRSLPWVLPPTPSQGAEKGVMLPSGASKLKAGSVHGGMSGTRLSPAETPLHPRGLSFLASV